MICWMNSAAQRRFTTRSLLGALLVVLLTAVAAVAFRLGHLSGALAYPVAAMPALPILWLLAETARYLNNEKDEFQRNLLVQCLLGGIGGTLATTTVWSNLEHFARAPHLDSLYVYPIFWLFVILSAPVVIARYR
jgi:hypothetical protein